MATNLSVSSTEIDDYGISRYGDDLFFQIRLFHRLAVILLCSITNRTRNPENILVNSLFNKQTTTLNSVNGKIAFSGNCNSSYENHVHRCNVGT